MCCAWFRESWWGEGGWLNVPDTFWRVYLEGKQTVRINVPCTYTLRLGFLGPQQRCRRAALSLAQTVGLQEAAVVMAKMTLIPSELHFHPEEWLRRPQLEYSSLCFFPFVAAELHQPRRRPISIFITLFAMAKSACADQRRKAGSYSP